MSYIAQNSAGIFIHSRWSDCPAPEIDQEASETESETSTMDNHRQESSGSSNFTQKDLLFAIPRQLSDAQQPFESELVQAMSDEIDDLRAQNARSKGELYNKDIYILRLEELLNLQETHSCQATASSGIPPLNRLTPSRINYEQLPSSSNTVSPSICSPQTHHHSKQQLLLPEKQPSHGVFHLIKLVDPSLKPLSIHKEPIPSTTASDLCQTLNHGGNNS